MTKFPGRQRYSAWDGSQLPIGDADAMMRALADDLMEFGDLHWAMRNLLSRGMPLPQGGYLQGLRDMIRQLREQKQRQLKRYNLDSVFDDVRARLDDIIDMERQRIAEWRERAAATDSFSDSLLKDIAERNATALDALPDALGERLRALEKFEFIDPEAQKKFIALLNELRESVAQTVFADVRNLIDSLSEGDMARTKAMLKALNDMIVRHIAGEDPQFEAFMQRFGDLFGDPPPASLADLLEQMRQQMAAAHSLMQSLTPQQQQALADLFSGRFGDTELEAEMARLVKELEFLNPGGQAYRFSGDENLDLQSALQMMQDLGAMDALLSQLEHAERQGDLTGIDQDLVREFMGDEEADQLGQLEQLRQQLEDAGWVRKGDDDEWELTPRGSRRIAQEALGEIYQRLKNQSLGNHTIPEEGRFGERTDDTKAYEFGDPFHLHLPRTLRNALRRTGPGSPIALQPVDFEIYRSEQITSTATAMLVDLSWSMALRGSFVAAKKVALALHNLITRQYPKDSFYIIGFAAEAKELKPHELPYLQWDEYVLGTNMQHALLLAERLLAKHTAGSKQIIMISDGEPTAHLEHGEAVFAYPPTAQTLHATFQAVRRCTRKGIAINTFMLESSAYLRAFMQEVARINGGRVFFTSPDQLGEYILVDFVEHRRTKISR